MYFMHSIKFRIYNLSYCSWEEYFQWPVLLIHSRFYLCFRMFISSSLNEFIFLYTTLNIIWLLSIMIFVFHKFWRINSILNIFFSLFLSFHTKSQLNLTFGILILIFRSLINRITCVLLISFLSVLHSSLIYIHVYVFQLTVRIMSK